MDSRNYWAAVDEASEAWREARKWRFIAVVMFISLVGAAVASVLR